MRAMVLRKFSSMDLNDHPLELAEMPTPSLASDELLIRIAACGVCHTEVDEIEGRAKPSFLPIIPGHQVIGRIESTGPLAGKYSVGDRVGVGWIYDSTGDQQENLSPAFRATGKDVNGGYAELMVAKESYAYPIPEGLSDEQAAPLLCAGAIGFRSLRLTHLENGQALGLTGFGGSGHLVIQLAKHQFPDSPIHVFARDPLEREFAKELGACWVGDTAERSPEPLHAIIDTTPAWTPVVAALSNLRPGGRLVINAIRKKEDDKQALLNLDFGEHLWMEREIKSVANIAATDISEFLPIAVEAGIQPAVQVFPLEDANTALVEMSRGSIRGAKVLKIN